MITQFLFSILYSLIVVSKWTFLVRVTEILSTFSTLENPEKGVHQHSYFSGDP